MVYVVRVACHIYLDIYLDIHLNIHQNIHRDIYLDMYQSVSAIKVQSLVFPSSSTVNLRS